jgi:hypothetical protein
MGRRRRGWRLRRVLWLLESKDDEGQSQLEEELEII